LWLSVLVLAVAVPREIVEPQAFSLLLVVLVVRGNAYLYPFQNSAVSGHL
jgi:hypothetical protein